MCTNYLCCVANKMTFIRIWGWGGGESNAHLTLLDCCKLEVDEKDIVNSKSQKIKLKAKLY